MSNGHMMKIKGLYLPMIADKMVTGHVFWVDSSVTGALDAAGYGKSPDKPFATLDYAFGTHGVTASNGDIVVIGRNHAETVTTAITMDKADVQVIGIANGAKMPVITPSGAIDAVTMTADGCSIANVEFAVPGVDNQTADINIAAADCSVFNTRHHMSTTAKNKVDCITITAAGHDFLLDGLRIWNTTVEATSAISIEGACSRGEIRFCNVQDAIGFASGCVMDEATALMLYIHHNVFSNAKADTVVVEFGNNSTGVCSFNHINGRHTTLASNVTAGTGMVFFENRAVEEAAVNGAVIPAADTD